MTGLPIRHSTETGGRAFTAIAGVTLAAITSRRRTLIVLLFVAAPVLLALLTRLVSPEDDPTTISIAVYDGLVVRVVLPIVALIFGTAVLGAEIDDGTVVYTLAKPVPRWEIVGAKLLVAGVVTLALVVTSSIAAGALLVVGVPGADGSVVTGYTAGIAVGAVVYVAVFLAMSVVTSRALVLGLGYVLIWEGFLASLFAGTKNLSVREYTLAIANAVAGRQLGEGRPLDAAPAVVMAIVVTVVAVAVAIRRLRSFEAKETA